MSKYDIRKARDRDKLRTERAIELAALDANRWPTDHRHAIWWAGRSELDIRDRAEQAVYVRAMCVAEMQYLNGVDKRIFSGELRDDWEGQDSKSMRTFVVRPDPNSDHVECVYDTTSGNEVLVGRIWPSNFYVVEGQMRHGEGYLAELPGQSPSDELDHFTDNCPGGARGTAIRRLLSAARK